MPPYSIKRFEKLGSEPWTNQINLGTNQKNLKQHRRARSNAQIRAVKKPILKNNAQPDPSSFQDAEPKKPTESLELEKRLGFRSFNGLLNGDGISLVVGHTWEKRTVSKICLSNFQSL